MDERGGEFDEGWAEANRLVSKHVVFPNLYSATVRAIRGAPEILRTEDPARLAAFAVRAALFPVKVSPTLKAVFYHAAEEADRSSLAAARPLTTERLLGLFHPSDIAAVITLVLLSRTIRRSCEDEEWGRLVPKMRAHMLVGGLVGQAVRGVGYGNGLLAAGARVLGQGVLLRSDWKAFKELRRKTERARALFLPEEELELFGCTHLQVAAGLLAGFGYGIGPRMAFGVGSIDPALERLRGAAVDAKEEADRWAVTIACTERVHAEGKLPRALAARLSAAFVPGAADQLTRESGVLTDGGAGCNWLWRTKEEVPDAVKAELGIPVGPAADDPEPEKVPRN